MKTEYVQTELETIADNVREAYRIRGRVRGVHLIPLAKGESPTGEQTGTALNTAAAKELEEVCGIGEELARAIVLYRNEHGPFETVDSLRPIAGIGRSTAFKIWSAVGE